MIYSMFTIATIFLIYLVAGLYRVRFRLNISRVGQDRYDLHILVQRPLLPIKDKRYMICKEQTLEYCSYLVSTLVKNNKMEAYSW